MQMPGYLLNRQNKMFGCLAAAAAFKVDGTLIIFQIGEQVQYITVVAIGESHR